MDAIGALESQYQFYPPSHSKGGGEYVRLRESEDSPTSDSTFSFCSSESDQLEDEPPLEESFLSTVPFYFSKLEALPNELIQHIASLLEDDDQTNFSLSSWAIHTLVKDISFAMKLLKEFDFGIDLNNPKKFLLLKKSLADHYRIAKILRPIVSKFPIGGYFSFEPNTTSNLYQGYFQRIVDLASLNPPLKKQPPHCFGRIQCCWERSCILRNCCSGKITHAIELHQCGDTCLQAAACFGTLVGVVASVFCCVMGCSSPQVCLSGAVCLSCVGSISTGICLCENCANNHCSDWCSYPDCSGETDKVSKYLVNFPQILRAAEALQVHPRSFSWIPAPSTPRHSPREV